MLFLAKSSFKGFVEKGKIKEVMKLTEGKEFNIATVNYAPDKVIGKHGFGPHKAKLKKDI